MDDLPQPTAHLRLAPPDGLDEERKTKIANALHQYRETVKEHNLIAVRMMVDAMEVRPDPPNWSPSLAKDMRIEPFRRNLGPLPASVALPRDILGEEVRGELIRQARLDGLSHENVDPHARAEFFAAVRARILEEKVDEALAEFPPPDLEYLCTLIGGITGSGLPFHQECSQFAFVSPLRDHPLAYILNVVVPLHSDEDLMAPGNEFDDLWEGWEVAVAFRMGVGIRLWGGSYALFCRSERQGHEQWNWRYGVHDEEWSSDVYDTVEEFLGSYAHFREETDEDIGRYYIRSLSSLL